MSCAGFATRSARIVRDQEGRMRLYGKVAIRHSRAHELGKGRSASSLQVMDAECYFSILVYFAEAVAASIRASNGARHRRGKRTHQRAPLG